jgi:hypothetical protein
MGLLASLLGELLGCSMNCWTGRRTGEVLRITHAVPYCARVPTALCRVKTGIFRLTRRISGSAPWDRSQGRCANLD